MANASKASINALMGETVQSEPQAKRLDLWQRKLLPFMVVSITVMAVFFFIASLWQLQEFRSETHARLDQVSAGEKAWQSDSERDYMQWRVLVQLETNVVARRYEQLRTTMLLRAWTRYVGFLTGMILALVGAVFVLGKLGSGEGHAATDISAESSGLSAKVTTPYPGVALAFLGTLLMGLSILVPFSFETRDSPAYLAPASMKLRVRGSLESPHDEPPEPWADPDADPPAPKPTSRVPPSSSAHPPPRNGE